MTNGYVPKWEKNSFENQAKENDVNNIYPPMFLDMATDHAIQERTKRAREIDLEIETLHEELKDLKLSLDFNDAVREAKNEYLAKVRDFEEQHKRNKYIKKSKGELIAKLRKERSQIVKELLNGMGL